MRLLIAGVLLFGLLFAPIAVFAEGNVTTIDDTEMVTISKEATNPLSPSADQALLFGKVHTTLLMATEEAFGYLLMNDEAEKQAFYDELTASEEAFAAFEEAAANAGENETILVTGYEQVMEEYANMTIAADAMFASFEKEGKPVLEDVILFEESVDAIFNATDNTWVDHRAGGDIPVSANSSVRALYGRLLAAVEESYAYPVLGDMVEKEDALADFTEFDTRIVLHEETYPDTSVDDLKVVKNEIQEAAEAMFASYEENGSINGDEAAALEALVEKMNTDCLKQFGQISSEETPVSEPTLESNETVVNSTV